MHFDPIISFGIVYFEMAESYPKRRKKHNQSIFRNHFLAASSVFGNFFFELWYIGYYHIIFIKFIGFLILALPCNWYIFLNCSHTRRELILIRILTFPLGQEAAFDHGFNVPSSSGHADRTTEMYNEMDRKGGQVIVILKCVKMKTGQEAYFKFNYKLTIDNWYLIRTTMYKNNSNSKYCIQNIWYIQSSISNICDKEIFDNFFIYIDLNIHICRAFNFS